MLGPRERPPLTLRHRFDAVRVLKHPDHLLGLHQVERKRPRDTVPLGHDTLDHLAGLRSLYQLLPHFFVVLCTGVEHAIGARVAPKRFLFGLGWEYPVPLSKVHLKHLPDG